MSEHSSKYYHEGENLKGATGIRPLNGAIPGEPGLQRHPNSARFHQILKSLGELHDRKQMDYGQGKDPFANVRSSQDFGVPAWVGAMIRLNDKVKRLQSLSRKGKLYNESAVDSFKDIAVYAVIALVLYEQEVGAAQAEQTKEYIGGLYGTKELRGYDDGGASCGSAEKTGPVGEFSGF